MEDIDFKFKISIVGLGLIGGSFGKAIRKLEPEAIYGIDYNEDTINKACQMNIIDEGNVDGSGFINKSDIVVLAVYPEAAIEFVEKNKKNFKPGALVTDVCGIKQSIVKQINEILPKGVEYVAGHPMAGRECSGIDFADEKLFVGTNYIITPHELNNDNSIKLIEKIAYGLGCKIVVKISPEQHDEIIAFTSQLPHVIAVALMNSQNFSENIGIFTGGSFRDATRVAAINFNLWHQLFFMNSKALISEIESFEYTLGKIKTVIQNKDSDELSRLMTRSETERKKLV